MNDIEKKELKKTACRVRMGILDATYAAQSGHPGGSLSAADLFTYLYFRELRIDPKNPKWEDRDRFVLSKGHTAPGLYSGENRDCSRYRGAGETQKKKKKKKKNKQKKKKKKTFNIFNRNIKSKWTNY